MFFYNNEAIKTADESDSISGSETDTAYNPGSRYLLKEDLVVREKPSVDARQLKRSEIADEESLIAYEGEDAVLKRGCMVQCREAKDDWMRIQSGWICCRDGSEVYITEPFQVKCDMENGRFDKDRYVDENGQIFSFNETEESLSGSYNVRGSDENYIDFSTDGSCIYHIPAGSGSPHFSEDGTCDGRYNYRNEKVYFILGGTTVGDVYSVINGELVRE